MDSQSDTILTAPAHIQMQFRLPLLWLALLLFAAFVLPDPIWNTLLIGIGGLFAVSYIWVKLLEKGLHGTRKLRFSWVSVGDRLEETFTLVNLSSLPALWVEVVDHSNIPGYRTAVVRSVGANQKIEWRESAFCAQRGLYQLGPWTIRSSDPFGIFILTRHYPVHSEVIIHPPIHTDIPIPLPSGQSSGRVRARERSWRATINAASVRDYQPADPYRWIHWPTSARRDTLFVRQFDLDAAGDIWLLLDLQAQAQVGDGLEGTEEHAVLIGAALAARALQRNRPFGLAGYGRIPQIVPPGQGTNQRWKLLRALALVNADGDNTLTQAIRDLSQMVRRKTAVVIITATQSTDWIPELTTLSRKGVGSNVILLDRPSFGGEGNSKGMQELLFQLGFSCHLVRQGEVGQAPEITQRRGIWEFRVTGTGRVVTVQSPFSER